MNDQEVLEVVERHRGDATPLLGTPGVSRVMGLVNHRDPKLPDMAMSYAAPTGFGIALARPDLKVIAVEGDGSFLMGFPSTITIGRDLPSNLIVVVINNRTYLASWSGALESASAVRADLVALARAAGIKRSMAADTVEEFEGHFHEAMLEEGPTLIVANVDATPRTGPLPAGHQPDRAENAMLFQRYLREVCPPPDGGVHEPQAREPSSRPAPGEGAPQKAARYIYDSLKEAGIDLFVYLPETVLYPVMELAENDPEMTAICCTREDEGVAIAGGALHGGRQAVLSIEGNGVGFSGLALSQATFQRVPLLLIASHSRLFGIRLPWDHSATTVNEPILHALNIHTAMLTHLSDARVFIRESLRAAKVMRAPAAIVVPPYVMEETPPSSP